MKKKSEKLTFPKPKEILLLHSNQRIYNVEELNEIEPIIETLKILATEKIFISQRDNLSLSYLEKIEIKLLNKLKKLSKGETKCED